MDPSDLFKRFFGFGNSRPRPDDEFNRHDHTHQYPPSHEQDQLYSRPSPPSSFQFEVFTNPLEMHKFFDEQMDQILKAFGFSQGFGSGVPNIGSIPWGEQPALEQAKPGSREFMLKDGFGYSNPSPDTEKVDTDLDDELQGNAISKLFPEERSLQPHTPRSSWLTPFFEGHQPQGSFSYSFSQKTVRHPDGTVEKHETRRSGDGVETTTVTKTVNGQTHEVITTRKSNGEEETVENVTDYPMLPNSPPVQGPPFGGGSILNHSLFDKFFGKSD